VQQNITAVNGFAVAAKSKSKSFIVDLSANHSVLNECAQKGTGVLFLSLKMTDKQLPASCGHSSSQGVDLSCFFSCSGGGVTRCVNVLGGGNAKRKRAPADPIKGIQFRFGRTCASHSDERYTLSIPTKTYFLIKRTILEFNRIISESKRDQKTQKKRDPAGIRTQASRIRTSRPNH
jgi:hypothetical protein